MNSERYSIAQDLVFLLLFMKSDLQAGTGSNYVITLEVGFDDKNSAKEKVLKEFQKEVSMPGFRKGHVPLSLVEKQVKPEYLSMSVYERLISDFLQKLVSEEKDKKFIGAPYDINFDDKDDKTIITLRLDVYPEVVVSNDDRRKVSIKKIDPKVPTEEKKASILQFKKQYADYQDTDKIDDMTVTKVNYKFFDKSGNELGKSVMYVGDEEAQQHPWLKETFRGKKGGESLEIAYDEKKLPSILHQKKDSLTPEKIVFDIGDVKKIVLPTFDDATIKKLFGDDAKVTNETEVEQMIEETMKEERFSAELMKNIESILQDLMKKTLTITIPKTMIEEEQKQRIKNVQQRFGGKESFENYAKQLGDEKYQAMLGDIKRAAKESLEKFMVFRKLVELHELDVNWEKDLDAESKLYEKITGEKPFRSEFLEKINTR